MALTPAHLLSTPKTSPHYHPGSIVLSSHSSAGLAHSCRRAQQGLGEPSLPYLAQAPSQFGGDGEPSCCPRNVKKGEKKRYRHFGTCVIWETRVFYTDTCACSPAQQELKPVTAACPLYLGALKKSNMENLNQLYSIQHPSQTSWLRFSPPSSKPF